MSEFKVGDTVKIINNAYGGYNNGDVTKILQLDYDSKYVWVNGNASYPHGVCFLKRNLLKIDNDFTVIENVTQPSNTLPVKIKKLHKDAVVPKYAKAGDAALDLTAVSIDHISEDTVRYDIGLAFEIPEGYVGLIYPRSSICKKDLILSNSTGVVDSGYRGTVQAYFKKTKGMLSNCYAVGDRICQIMIVPYPKVELIEVEELSETDRGTGGFGSSGA